MAVSYYIYYRVARPDQAGALVRKIQAKLKCDTGIEGRMLTKRDDPSTWMEVYEGVTQSSAFEACLDDALRAADFGVVLESGSVRHMECFEEPCA